MTDGMKIYSNLRATVLTVPGEDDSKTPQNFDWSLSYGFGGDSFFEVASAQTSNEGMVSIGNE